ncbi:MAG: hypothetical protein N3D82_05215 [Ignisphaera sp.]|nr:hypothetical protein [Ignisphaera sp.]
MHDLVALYPFEGAINRTSAIIIEKICESSGAADFNKCPDPSTVTDRNRKVRHTIWISRTGNPIPTGAQLEEVLRSTDRYQAIMVPIVERDPSSPWMQITEKVLPYLRRVITGESPYTAHEGVLTGLNQVFYVQVKGKLPDGRLLITNPPESGQKKRVKQVEAAVEPDLIYPLVRGRDAKKWYVHYSNRYIINNNYSRS